MSFSLDQEASAASSSQSALRSPAGDGTLVCVHEGDSPWGSSCFWDRKGDFDILLLECFNHKHFKLWGNDDGNTNTKDYFSTSLTPACEVMAFLAE